MLRRKSTDDAARRPKRFASGGVLLTVDLTAGELLVESRQASPVGQAFPPRVLSHGR